MSTPYSRRPESVAATRAFLISVRHRPDSELPRYGKLAEVYGGIARAVAPVLNAVARDCPDAGSPISRHSWSPSRPRRRSRVSRDATHAAKGSAVTSSS